MEDGIRAQLEFLFFAGLQQIVHAAEALQHVIHLSHKGSHQESNPRAYTEDLPNSCRQCAWNSFRFQYRIRPHPSFLGHALCAYEGVALREVDHYP